MTQRSTFWSNLSDNLISSFMRDRWEQRLSSRLRIVEMVKEVGGSVLDCGFGSGPFFEFFKRTSIEYVGIDVTPNFVRCCRERFHDDRSRFLLGDVLHIPFRDRCFSTVFCSSLLEHLPPNSIDQSIREMIRVSKTQTILDFYRPLLEGETEIHWSTHQYWDNGYNREEVMDLIRSIEVRDISSFLVKMGEGFTDHEIVRVMKSG